MKDKSIKILHLPMEFAAQMSLAVKGLQKCGIKATSAAEKNPFGFPFDIEMRAPKNPYLVRLVRAYYAIKFFLRYDIYQHHGGGSLLPFAIDAKLNKLFGRKILVEFYGSDIRQHKIEEEKNPFFKNIAFSQGKVPDPIRRMERWASLTEGVVVQSDHSFYKQLSTCYNTIYIVGQRVDISKFSPIYPNKTQECPVIVHAPSHSGIKGTKYLEDALTKLKSNGVNFIYKRVSGLSHAEAMKVYKNADIIVDQLLLGTHGIFSCEGMALGKPVICYIMDEMKNSFPKGFPIINANPDTIEEELLKWINSPELRHSQGKLSRKYAEDIHDHIKVGKRLETIYTNHLQLSHPKGIIDMRTI